MTHWIERVFEWVVVLSGLILLANLVSWLSGCTSISYEHEGTRVTYSAIFKDISELEAKVPGGAKIQVGHTGVDAEGVTAVSIPIKLVPIGP